MNSFAFSLRICIFAFVLTKTPYRFQSETVKSYKFLHIIYNV